MNSINLTFYLFSAALVIFSLLAVTSRKLLRAAIYLLFVLVGVAVFYLMLDYLFLAAVQVIVYLGGILVLVIFSILLTSQLGEKVQVVPKRNVFAAALTAIIGAGLVMSVLLESNLKASTGPEAEYDVEAIGTSLLSYEKYGYVLPFEVISILLLAALIGAIVVAKRPKPKSEIND